MKPLTFFCFLLCYCSVIAQDSTWTVDAKLQPFMLINPDKPYIQGAIDIGFKGKVHLEIAYGRRYLNAILSSRTSNRNRPFHKPFRGESISASLYTPISKNKKLQIGFHYRYINDVRNRGIIYFDTLGISPDITDVFAIQRKIHIYSLRLYYNIKIDNRFSFSFVCELGIRSKERKIDGEDFEFDPTSGNYDRVLEMFGPTHNEYRRSLAHLMPSFFLVYRLK